jgi:hypothetical protein
MASIGTYTGSWRDVLSLVDWLAMQLSPREHQLDDAARDRDDYRNELLIVALRAATKFRADFEGTYTDEKRYVAKALWNAYRNWQVRRWHGFTTVSLDDFLTFEREGVTVDGYLEARDALRRLETVMQSKRLETLIAWELGDRPDDRVERKRLRVAATRARGEARALL